MTGPVSPVGTGESGVVAWPGARSSLIPSGNAPTCGGIDALVVDRYRSDTDFVPPDGVWPLIRVVGLRYRGQARYRATPIDERRPADMMNAIRGEITPMRTAGFVGVLTARLG